MLPTTSERSRCVARSSLPTSVHHDLPAALRTCAHRKHSLARPHTTATTEKTCGALTLRGLQWRFHLLGPKTVQRVCELNAELVTVEKGASEGEKKLKRWLEIPGWLVVTCVSTTSTDGSAGHLNEPAGEAREDYAATCCAIQNLCLSLHADGLGTKWTTGKVNFDPRFGDAAGLPSNEYVVGTIWFGAAAGVPPLPPKKRLSLAEVLSRHE